jgi:hypothetical protein
VDSIFIRFPDGTREFRMGGRVLEVGQLVHHAGERYRVTQITEDGGGHPLAIVALESPSIGDVLASEDGGIVLEEILA